MKAATALGSQATAQGGTLPLADGADALLAARLGLLEHRVRHAVTARAHTGPGSAANPFHGLCVTDEEAVELLSGPVAEDWPLSVDESDWSERILAAEAAAEASGQPVPLRSLVVAFELTPIEADLLVTALAPDIDARFERLYGYLNDDLTRRHATAGLALRLCHVPSAHARARALLSPTGPLCAGGLLTLEDETQPFLSRMLRVPDRVSAYLLDHHELPPELRNAATPAAPPAPLPPGPLTTAADRLSALVAPGRPVYLRDEPGGAATAVAEAALWAAGCPPLRLDTTRLPPGEDGVHAVRAAVREARLRGGGLVAGIPSELPGRQDVPDLLDLLTRAPVPVVLTGRNHWDVRWTPLRPVLIECPPLATAARTVLWRQALDGHAKADALAAAMSPYRLGPSEIRTSAEAALGSAGSFRKVDEAALRAAARACNAGRLTRLARRVPPGAGWDDLVLPALPHGQLRELTRRARHRDQVLGTWRMRPGGGRGHGVMALFSGPSGTGKTLAAEVVAADLGLDLYVINLATVVDKYIGETEKHLEHIFDEAEIVNGVLLFDEADALFGRRTETRDARDRYANIEIAYLLQRLEAFDGVAVLTTNLAANLDPAFLRRLDSVVHFQAPDTEQRRALWELGLGPALPRGSDVDTQALAAAFELTGGAIRCCAVTAAYAAAATGRPVTMDDLYAAVRAECRKLGRFVDEEAFRRPDGSVPPDGSGRPARGRRAGVRRSEEPSR